MINPDACSWQVQRLSWCSALLAGSVFVFVMIFVVGVIVSYIFGQGMTSLMRVITRLIKWLLALKYPTKKTANKKDTMPNRSPQSAKHQ